MKRKRAWVYLSWDLDPIPGWNHDAADLLDRLKAWLDDSIPHYNPTLSVMRPDDEGDIGTCQGCGSYGRLGSVCNRRTSDGVVEECGERL